MLIFVGFDVPTDRTGVALEHDCELDIGVKPATLLICRFTQPSDCLTLQVAKLAARLAPSDFIISEDGEDHRYELRVGNGFTIGGRCLFFRRWSKSFDPVEGDSFLERIYGRAEPAQ